MRHKSTSFIPEPIVQLQRELEQFRGSHAHRTRLPESLWQSAMELAREHGLHAVARRSRIRFIAYNTRFLILPWVRVEHPASHILGRMAARISDDSEQMYDHPIYFLETFIDPERFRGTCYRAANWVLMGRTTGRGKQSNSYVPNRSIKEVLGYPLTKHFRELLGGMRAGAKLGHSAPRERCSAAE